MANVPGAKLSDWGAHIGKAPGTLVGPYAVGDVDRTKALFDHCYAYAEQNGMVEAYERELRLAPILAESTVRGTRIDSQRLQEEARVYLAAKKAAEEYVFRQLGEFNIDSDREFADALDRAGQVDEWVLTPTGKRSTARKNLVGRIKDAQLLAAIAYRGVLSTCLGTFAFPWLEQAAANKGRVHPQWNQVRGDRGADGDLTGTRTGRMSCRDPNLQNIPNDFDGLAIPDFIRPIVGDLNPVILMRRYMLPEEGHTWLKRDFAAQEMRIMAHFAEGKLYEAYQRDPNVDPHDMVRGIIRELTGQEMPRKYVKITGFGIMYGRGIANLSAALGVPDHEGKGVRDAYFAALPEVKQLSQATRNAGKSGTGIRTWGGRVYFREPDPTGRDLSYKLLNYLIQGSAADQTKQSAIDWYNTKGANDHLLCLVHDEDNISAPIGEERRAMRLLREAMDADRFDVPFRSEGFSGPNWADIKGFDDEC
jgi:DNA polymerase-1